MTNAESELATWVRGDPYNWATLQAMFKPWLDGTTWHDDTPAWLSLLDEIASTANKQFGPFNDVNPVRFV